MWYHACHHSHRLNELATNNEKWNGKPRLDYVKWSTSTSENSCGCTALDMPEWREITEQTDWWAKQPSEFACFSEDLKCWAASDTTCVHKAKGITPLITWRREAWKEESVSRSSLKGRERAIVNQTNIGTVSKAMLGMLVRDGVDRIWAFPSA